LENVLDTVRAADSLGNVEQVDVSVQRLSVQEIMVVMGWRFYEQAKALTLEQLQLPPLYRLITEN
jgi:hypothetical protein